MAIDKDTLKALAAVLKGEELYSAYQKATDTKVTMGELNEALGNKAPSKGKTYKMPTEKTKADKIQKDSLAKLCETYRKLKPLNSSMTIQEIGKAINEIRADLLKFTKEKV